MPSPSSFLIGKVASYPGYPDQHQVWWLTNLPTTSSLPSARGTPSLCGPSAKTTRISQCLILRSAMELLHCGKISTAPGRVKQEARMDTERFLRDLLAGFQRGIYRTRDSEEIRLPEHHVGG